jgi:hypothetical protein
VVEAAELAEDLPLGMELMEVQVILVMELWLLEEELVLLREA